MIPWLGRSPGGRHGNPVQYSWLENPHGQRSLAGCSLWGHKESDTTGRLSTAHISVKASEGSDTFTMYKIYWFHSDDFRMKDITYHLLDIILIITLKVNSS